MNRRNFITSLLALPVVSLLEKITPKIRPQQGIVNWYGGPTEEWGRIKRIRVYRRPQPSSVAQQAFHEVDASDKAVQRATGICHLGHTSLDECKRYAATAQEHYLGQTVNEYWEGARTPKQSFTLQFSKDAFWRNET